MKKILIIEDSQLYFERLQMACKENGFEGIVFEPEYDEDHEIIEQLKKLLSEEKFEFVILDYELWGDFTGNKFVSVFKEAKVPFFGFSGEHKHNKSFKEWGAFAVAMGLPKDELMDSVLRAKGFLAGVIWNFNKIKQV